LYWSKKTNRGCGALFSEKCHLMSKKPVTAWHQRVEIGVSRGAFVLRISETGQITSDTCSSRRRSQLVSKRRAESGQASQGVSAGVDGYRGKLTYGASEQIVKRVHHMRCEIPHRCVRRKYRVRRHSPYRLRNCWEGRSVRASSLLCPDSGTERRVEHEEPRAERSGGEVPPPQRGGFGYWAEGGARGALSGAQRRGGAPTPTGWGSLSLDRLDEALYPPPPLRGGFYGVADQQPN
jgi:hypothetical protein